MNENVKLSRLWLVIILLGIISFVSGYHFRRLFFEGLGAIASSGAIVCIIFDIFIKIFRKKRGERF